MQGVGAREESYAGRESHKIYGGGGGMDGTKYVGKGRVERKILHLRIPNGCKGWGLGKKIIEGGSSIKFIAGGRGRECPSGSQIN